MLLGNRQVLQFGLETVYGTDPVLTTTAAILASNVNLTPLAGSTKDRQRAHADFGADPPLHVGTYMTISFDVDLAGSGAAGTAPLYGPLLKACDMAETVTADTSVVYAPQVFASATAKSATIYFTWGGVKYKLTGARGTFSFKVAQNDVPSLSFTFTGLYNAAVDAAFPSVETVLASWIDGIEANAANTTFSLHATTPTLQSLQIDYGNTVTFRDRPNAAIVAITDRKIAGSTEFEQPTVASKAWLEIARVGTMGALQLVHGTVAGNIVQVDAGKAQLIQPKVQNSDNILHISSNLQLNRYPAGTEFSLTVK